MGEKRMDLKADPFDTIMEFFIDPWYMFKALEAV
jgi:hypothetical protein